MPHLLRFAKAVLFFLLRPKQKEGHMEHLHETIHGTVCEALLLDLICYEKYRGNLSPEMEYLFDKHLKECLSCRQRMHGFRTMIDGEEIARNYG